MGHEAATGDRYVDRLVRWVARSLERRPEFRDLDAQDIEQDLRLDLLVRWDNFDPEKSSLRTFANRVVRNCASRLIEKHAAECRNPTKVIGTVDQLEDPEDGGRPTTVDDFLRATATGTADRSALRIDLEKALRRMPPEIREVCHLRSMGLSVPEVAKEAGVSPRTVHRTFATARERLRQSGVHEYLE